MQTCLSLLTSEEVDVEAEWDEESATWAVILKTESGGHRFTIINSDLAIQTLVERLIEAVEHH